VRRMVGRLFEIEKIGDRGRGIQEALLQPALLQREA
jgi:hypothetical protein